MSLPRLMFRSFWFYFYSIPVLFSFIVFSMPLTFFYDLLNSSSFQDSLEFCKDVINDDVYATEYGTMQDKCINNYMGEPRIFEPLIFLFAIIGFFVIIPLLVYLIFSFRRNK